MRLDARMVGVAIGSWLALSCGGSPAAPTPQPQPPPAPNSPPVITAITAQGPRANQPPDMGDLGEALTIVATALDNETPPDALTYQWSATAGTFETTGPVAIWRAPSSATQTPFDVQLMVTVVEPYQVLDAQGRLVDREHRVSQAHTVRVHDSEQEVSDLSVRFLTRFSIASFSPEEVVADFSDSCPGKEDELEDTANVRCEFFHDDYRIGEPQTSIVFGGSCPSPHTPFIVPGDACVQIDVRWETTATPGVLSCPRQLPGLAPGQKGVAEGVDFLSAVYEARQWRLCTSNFLSTLPGGLDFWR